MGKINLVKREVYIPGKKRVYVDLNNPVYRYYQNPILNSHMVNKIWKYPELRVKTVHNAGAVEFNGQTIILFRCHLRSGVSIIGLARSKNGFTNWEIDSYPAMVPCQKNDSFAAKSNKKELIENESGGIEDPRVTKLGNIYAITYSAYHAHIKNKVRVSLATTKDFKTFTRHGPVLDQNMRNVVFFSEKIKGNYVGLFRFNDNSPEDLGGKFTQIMIGYNLDWVCNPCWNVLKKPIIKTGGGPSAMSDKIGPGAPPIKTKYGWLNIFHGVRRTMSGTPYVLGVALHELNDPTKVKISNIPILYPTSFDCNVNSTDYVHVPDVVFSCGAIRKKRWNYNHLLWWP